MIRYKVNWTDDALDQLAEIWLQSSNRDGVSMAAAAIDQQLSAAPLSLGSPMREGLRDLLVAPLRVLYWIDENTGSVEVVAANTRGPS